MIVLIIVGSIIERIERKISLLFLCVDMKGNDGINHMEKKKRSMQLEIEKRKKKKDCQFNSDKLISTLLTFSFKSQRILKNEKFIFALVFTKKKK